MPFRSHYYDNVLDIKQNIQVENQLSLFLKDTN